MSAVGDFFPMQLIHTGNTKRCLLKVDFPCDFRVTFTKNYWSNMEKAVDHFEKVIFPFFQKTKDKHCYPKQQMSLVIINTSKGQDNEVPKELCAKKFCEDVIVPHNLRNKFLPLSFDVSVNKTGKSFISEKYYTWMANEVSHQINLGISLCDVQIDLR